MFYHLDVNFLTHVHHIIRVLDPVRAELRHVHEAVAVIIYPYEGAKVLYARHRALVHRVELRQFAGPARGRRRGVDVVQGFF